MHILNKFTEEYDVILDGFKNHLKLSVGHMLTIDVICEKLNHWYLKNKRIKKKIK